MSTVRPNYYRILGLEPTASQDEIKKRYRELARRYHPDVNPSAEAAQKIKQINEAYHTLGDPDRRSTYDAERFLATQGATQRRYTGPIHPDMAGTPRRNTGPLHPDDAPPRRNTGPVGSSTFNFDGYGRTAQQPRRNTGQIYPEDAQARRNTGPLNDGVKTPQMLTVDRLVAEAQLAFVNRRYREAEDLCVQTLMIDKRNSMAHEIMGDIHFKRGKVESAVAEYSYAVQFNPRNYGLQAKLERLSGGPIRPAPTMTRPVGQSSWEKFVPDESRDKFLNVISFVLLVMFLVVTGLVNLLPGLPLGLPVPWLTEFSFTLIMGLGFNGVVGGILLAINGNMRPYLEEISAGTETQQLRRAPISLAGLLGFFSIFSFYLSFLIYILVAFTKNRFSASMLRLYTVTMIQVVLFAFLYHPEHTEHPFTQTLFSAGNILFPCMLFGWAVGDALRFRSR